jgi:hypothetical protein
MARHHLTWLLALLLLPLLWAEPASGQDHRSAEQAARAQLAELATELGLARGDVADLLLQGARTSPRSGAHFLHLAQHRGGIPIEGAVVSVVVSADGSVVPGGNRLLPAVAERTASPTPGLSALEATEIVVRYLDLDPREPLEIVERRVGPEQVTMIGQAGIAIQPIRTQLVYFPMPEGDIPLTWRVEIEPIGSDHWWSIKVDASTGEIVDRRDLTVHDHVSVLSGAADALTAAVAPVVSLSAAPTGGSVVEVASLLPDSYRVFPLPFESPIHGATHVVVNNPINNAPVGTYPAAVNSWHDTNGDGNANFTDTRGNNVDAYLDRAGDGSPDGARPSGGASLNFDFPIDLTQDPSNYSAGAVVNLFYWSNIVHDLSYQYGFTETAGNFQVSNFGRGAAGGDDVRAEAQSGADKDPPDVCNARFGTPVDGARPRMRMYVCDSATPWRDSDLNAGTVLHEYAHGITNRMTGGPANVNCLDNDEQMGEGWSDWYAIMFTQQAVHTVDTPRPYGTYHRNLAVDGPGLRPRAYSPDFSVNEFTYDNIKTASVPHGVGHVWATMLWDLNWGLIGTLFPEEGGASGGGYSAGASTNLYSGMGGNNLALQLVTDALSLQPCSPGFVDGRDAILSADLLLTGGANERIIWKAFARRGLGWSADQGSSASRSDGTEAFDMPPSLKNPPVADAGADQTLECAAPGGTLVALDGSGSFDLDFLEQTGTGLTYTWMGPFTEGGGSIMGEQVNVTLPKGIHVITLEVADALGQTHSDTVTITVEDTIPPVITLAGVDPQVLECAIDDYIELGATAVDQCDGPVAVVIDASDVDVLKVGIYDVVYTATDEAGNSHSETRTVEVEDTIPPEITLVNQPITLWPPRHQYVSFTRGDMVVEATDACNTDLGVDDVVITEASSDEDERGQGDGSGATVHDIVIAAMCDDLMLRAERAGTLNGRVYMVHFAANDGYNIGTADLEVQVPHTPPRPAIAEEPVYVVEGCEPVAPVATQLATRDALQGPETPESAAVVGGAEGDLPMTFSLGQSYPNPMSATAEVSFSLPEQAHVRITVYDMLGREVRVLVDTQLGAGVHRTTFDAGGLPTGIYVYRMAAGSFEQMRRLVITR